MTPADIQQLKEIITDSVKTTVNGKIDKINILLQEHIDADQKWKDAAQPAIAAWTNVSGLGKIVASFLGVLAAFGAAITGLVELLKVFKILR